MRWALGPLLLLIGPLLAIVGVLQLIWCVVDSGRSLASGRWPTARGTIESSEVQATRSGGGTAYTPKVVYAYEVRGAHFHGTRIWRTEFSPPPDQAQRIVSEFPVGSRVQVYFDPSAPDQSLLRPGLNWFSYVWFGLSCLSVLVGIGAFVVGRLMVSSDLPPNNRWRGP
jgi:hypothetical protein